MASRISAALKAKIGEELSDYDDAICQALDAKRPNLVDDIAGRIGTEVKSANQFMELYVDVTIAFDAVSKGADVFPEPAVDSKGSLQLRPPVGSEKRSDYAVKPPVKARRWINVEAKTPKRDDRRGSSNFGLYEDEFEKGVKRLWSKGLEPVSVGMHAKSGILKFKGGDLGRVVSHILNELQKFVRENGGKEGLFQRDIQFEGQDVATILGAPGRGRIAKGASLGGHNFDPADYVDRGQLAKDAPNVIWINLDRELLPVPDLVAGAFQEAFGAGEFHDISAAIVYADNRAREVIMNDQANMPLTADEQDYFREPFKPPQGPNPRR